MKKFKILSIDEKDMNELIKLELSSDQFEVSLLEAGIKTIDPVKSQKPDLILLEVAWEGADGLAFLKSLKTDEATQSIPVIVVSSKVFDDEIQDALDAGADDYVVKPYYGPLLVKRIQNLLK